MEFMNTKPIRSSFIVMGSIALLQAINQVSSHGRMMDPAQRSSLWRFGYTGAKINYDDNQLFCGGFQNQWGVHGGKCGVCGDPYQGPRLNEAGNKYGKGIISKTYTQGQAIAVTIELTANHKGYFEYGLCVHNSPTTPISEDCFNNNLLYIEESAGTQKAITSAMGTGNFTMTVQLPSGVTCSQCVLRWKYNTGNSWGCDASGCDIGKGNQEQFINCADIAIN